MRKSRRGGEKESYPCIIRHKGWDAVFDDSRFPMFTGSYGFTHVRISSESQAEFLLASICAEADEIICVDNQ